MKPSRTMINSEMISMTLPPSRPNIIIRSFEEGDAAGVQELFVRANQTLPIPPWFMAERDAHFQCILDGDCGRACPHYDEEQAAFWVAAAGKNIVGMLGACTLPSGQAMEFRRLCVDLHARRQGIARLLITSAEVECRRRNIVRIELCTSEFHRDAIQLYRNSGYRIEREETTLTEWGPVRKFHFTKMLNG
jgi:GNAT superfamily N-acetyltransferase